MDEEKYIFLEASYRFIRMVNQKYSTTRMSKNVQQQNSEHSHSHGQKFMALENTKTDFFTDLVTFDVESGLGAPRASTTPDKHQNLQRR
jgi:hypothetical protein